MSEVATLRMERRRGTDRREERSRLQRTQLGRMGSALRAEARQRREFEDALLTRILELQREVDRLLDQAGLEPLPPVDDEL